LKPAGRERIPIFSSFKERAMRHSGLVVSVVAGLAVLITNVPRAESQPVWTDILNVAGFGNMASGTYWRIGPNPQPGALVNTSLGSIGHTLALSVPTLTGLGNQTGSFTCGHVPSPVTFIESNQGSGIKGVGFFGSFNAPPGGVPLSYAPDNNLFESVFFHDDLCYGGSAGSASREYGFFLAASNSSIWVYWGTHENRPTVVQAQVQLPLSPNTMYYYEMYPVGNSSSCGFQVIILGPSFNTVYTNFFHVNSHNFGGTITARDPGFCGALTAPSGATGYVSANISASPGVSGALPPPSQLNTFMQRVFVGK
jgi:hypothetical protein